MRCGAIWYTSKIIIIPAFWPVAGRAILKLFQNLVSIQVYSEHSSSILKGNLEEIQEKTLPGTQEEPKDR